MGLGAPAAELGASGFVLTTLTSWGSVEIREDYRHRDHIGIIFPYSLLTTKLSEVV